jgi:hypothetical protein
MTMLTYHILIGTVRTRANESRGNFIFPALQSDERPKLRDGGCQVWGEWSVNHWFQIRQILELDHQQNSNNQNSFLQSR